MSQETVFTVLPSTGRTRFLDACYRRPPDATPVWFMRQAGRSFAYDRGIQGNLDPTLLLTSWSVIEAGMHDVLGRAGGRPGHIFNLGHGVPASTDTDLLRRLVDAVHEATRR